MGWQEQHLAAPVIKPTTTVPRQDGGVFPRALIKGKAAYCGNSGVISTTSSRRADYYTRPMPLPRWNVHPRAGPAQPLRLHDSKSALPG